MKYLIVIITFAFSISAFAGKKVDETLSIGPGGKISIDVVRGDVQVETWDKSAVRVTGELDDATKKFIFDANGDDAKIKVEIDDGFFKHNWGSGGSDLTVYIPESSSLEAAGVSTDYDVDGVEGGVTINTVSGDIDAQDIFKSADSSGKMKLASVSGDVEINGKAQHFDVNTVSGDIDAVIGLSELIDLASVSGDLDIEFELADDGRVDASTVSGDINLKFGNRKVNARFDLNTGPGGDIRNEITDDRPDTSSFIGSESIKFNSGNGSAVVEVETMSGSIKLSN
jgi:DUF4097 and DUF4098 domain-containing protein YvlB